MLVLGLQLAFVFALIILNGLLAMSELAVVSARTARLQQRVEQGDRGAAAALVLAQEPTRFLSTVQIGITLIGILAGAIGGATLAGHVAGWLEDLGLGVSLSDTVSVVIVVAGITYFSLIFGELVPKRLALEYPETLASFMARPLTLIARFSSPLVTILSVSTSSFLKLLGLARVQTSSVSEEEIRMMIGMSAESGTVAEAEAELLERVFHFGDRKVHEAMTARNEAVWVPRESSLKDFLSIYRESLHSRFPVYDQDPDQVVGILGIKDVLAALADGDIAPEGSIEPLVRPAYFVPETKLIGDLFREMQDRGVQMAVAIDEFGGTAGIVTLEQLLEEMVGQLHDEVRAKDVEIFEIDERTTRVDGSLSIEEARDDLKIDLPEGPYDTIAGFVLAALGRIPSKGDHVVFGEHRIIVEEMQGQRIETLRIEESGPRA